MNFSGARAWVSGANGFVGAALVHALVQEGAQVFGAVREGSDLYRLRDLQGALQFTPCDLVDSAAVNAAIARARPEWIFHCVGSTWHPGNPSGRREEFSASVLGTFHLCEALRAYPPRGIVHLSSSQEGAAAERAESFLPTSFRGTAKAAASLLLAQVARDLGVHFTVLRLASLYGPWQQPDRVVARLISAALSGTPPEIIPAPMGRDFIYVTDVAAAALRAAGCEGANGAAIGIGSGRLTSILELAQSIYALLQIPFPEPREFPARACDRAFHAVSPARAQQLLGWTPRVDLDTGLKLTLDWQRQHESRG